MSLLDTACCKRVAGRLVPRIRSPQDFYAGLLFIAIGGSAAWLAADYRFGTATRMGPGYLPSTLAWGTILLGLLIAGRSLAFEGEPVSRIVWRPLILVPAAIAVFGLLIEMAGLIPTILMTVVVGGLGARRMGKVEIVVVGLALALFCATLFVWALGEPMQLWPR